MNGENIAIIRKKRGIRQEELAHILAINTATLSRWENGHFEPNATAIKKLCDALHCTESELLNGTTTQGWDLRLITPKEARNMIGTMDLTGQKATASLAMSDTAMGLALSAGYDLWEDDSKFEELIEQLRHKRASALKLRKESW